MNSAPDTSSSANGCCERRDPRSTVLYKYPSSLNSSVLRFHPHLQQREPQNWAAIIRPPQCHSFSENCDGQYSCHTPFISDRSWCHHLHGVTSHFARVLAKRTKHFNPLSGNQ